MTIILDSGHGYDTAGKCSPDKAVREWYTARLIREELEAMLKGARIPCEVVNNETYDVSLHERARRVNKICTMRGASNCLMLSIHINAAGNGREWHTARGFSSFVCPKASDRSKAFAKAVWDQMKTSDDFRGNRSIPKCGYIEKSLYILRNTLCPAVLTENLFMDNREDCTLLMNQDVLHEIAYKHFVAIREFAGK